MIGEGRIDEYRLALACAIQIMCEDAEDCDGFTDRQLEIIEEYGPLLGIELNTVRDSYGEDMYQLTPKPRDVITQIKQDRDFRSYRAERRKARLVICVVLLVTAALLFLLASALYYTMTTIGR
jgi:hypothetical protein